MKKTKKQPVAPQKGPSRKELSRLVQQYGVERYVLGVAHELLREHLEATGKFSPEERTAWERDVLAPELAKGGVEITPKVYTSAPRVIATSGYVAAAPSPAPSVEVVYADTSQLHALTSH